jgi:hypothetical protein
MVFYKLYDRSTLQLVDSGIVRDYSVDYDYLSNNASTLQITDVCKGFKGDLVAVSEGMSLIVLGVVTAIDNADLKISFKHPKEIFNDSVLNVFKFTGLLNRRFDAVSGLRTIIQHAYIDTTDVYRKLPLTIQTFGEDLNAVWTDDSNTLDLLGFIDYLFDSYNVYLDFDIDFLHSRLIVGIRKNDTQGLILKDNIKLSKPELDNNELPKENKAVLFNKLNGNIVATYYLLQDNSITTNVHHANRILPPTTKYIEWDEVEAIKEGYTMEQLARGELGGNIYNHCILYKLAKKQTMVRATNFRYGDKITIMYEERAYDSIFTGLKFKMKDSFYTCIFGKTRIDFTDRMKMYNNRKFMKKE